MTIRYPGVSHGEIYSHKNDAEMSQSSVKSSIVCLALLKRTVALERFASQTSAVGDAFNSHFLALDFEAETDSSNGQCM